MQSVGSLCLDLSLETAFYNRQLAEAQRAAEMAGKAIESALERGSGRFANTKIVPQVDDRQLSALNKHLDLKQQHLRQVVADFQRNPIKVFVDDSELAKLGGIEQNSYAFTIDTEQLSSDISKAVETGMKSARGSGVLGEVLGAVGRGSLENIGKQITGDFTAQIGASIQGELGKVIGSSGFLGAKLGDAIAGSISGKIEKELPQSFKDIFATISDKLLPQNEKTIEALAFRSKRALSNDSKMAPSREQAVREQRNAKRAYDDIEIERSGSFQREAAIENAISRGNNLQEDLQGSLEYEVALGTDGDQGKIKELSDSLDEVAKLLRALDRQRTAISEERETIEKRLKAAGENLKKTTNTYKAVRPESIPSVYREALNDVAPGLDQSMVPKLLVADERLRKAGARAQYSIASNTVEVTQQLFDAIENGTTSLEDLQLLYHELQHAADFDFGSARGLQARRNGQPIGGIVTPTAEEMTQVAPLINQYEPGIRDLEMNAEVMGRRNAAIAHERISQKTERDRLYRVVGYGGAGVNELGQDAMRQAAGNIKDLKEIAAAKGLDIKEDLSSFMDSLIDINKSIKTLKADISGSSNLDSQSLKDIQENFGRQSNALRELQRAIKKYQAEFVEQVKAFDFANDPEADPWVSQAPANMAEIVAGGISSSGGSSAIAIADPWETWQQKAGRYGKAAIAKAQEVAPTRDDLKAAAFASGQAIRTVADSAKAAKEIFEAIAKSGAGQAMAATAKAGYSFALGVEALALDILPMGRGAKGLLQQTAVPAAAFGAATHFLPGGAMAADALMGSAHAMIGPAIEGAGAAAAGHVGGAITSALPWGMGGGLSAAATAAINGAAATAGEMAANTVAIVFGGKIVQATVARLTGLSSIELPKALPASKMPLALQPAKEVEFELVEATYTESTKALAQAPASARALPSAKASPKALPAAIDTIAQSVDQTIEDGLERARFIAKQVREAGARAKAIFAKDATQESIALAKTIVDFADGYIAEIQQTRTSAGAQMGSKEGDQLANTQAQISRARNTAKRFLAVNAPDELESMQRLDLTQVRKSLGDASQIKMLNQLLKEAEDAADRFDASFERINSKTAKEFEQSVRQTSKAVEQLTEDLSGVGAETEKSEQKTNGLLAVIKNGAAAFLGFKAVETILPLAKDFIGQASQAALQAQALERSISFAEGGGAAGAERLAKISVEARELGINLRSAQESYAQLAGSTRDTVLEGLPTQQISTALNTASASMGLNPERQELVGQAVAQIAAKGVVSMEELRQQLGESLPGAMAIAARAMNMTTAELSDLVSTGQLASEEFLPKFAAQLQAELAVAAESSAGSASASFNRLNNSIYELQVTAGKGILPVQAMGADIAAKAVSFISVNVETLLAILTALAATGATYAAQTLLGLASSATAAAGGFRGAAIAVKGFVTSLNTSSTAMRFVGIFALIEALQMFGKAANAGKNEFTEYVDVTSKGLTKLAALQNDTQAIRAPQTVKDVKGESLLEGTILGSAAGLVVGEERSNNFFRWAEQGVQKKLGLKTFAEAKNEGVMSTTNEQLFNSSEIRGQILGQFSSSGNAIGDLAEVKRIDQEIEQIQMKRRSLSATAVRSNSGSRAELDELKEREKTLISIRENSQERVNALQGLNQSNIEGLTGALEAYDDQLAGGKITQQQYEQNTGRLKTELQAAEQEQQRLNDALRSALTPLDAFERAWNSIRDAMADAGAEVDKLVRLEQTGLSRQVSTGALSSEQAQFASGQMAQQGDAMKLAQVERAINQLRSELSTVDAQTIFSQLGLNESSGLAETSRMAEYAQDPRQKLFVEKLAELKTLEAEFNQSAGSLADAQAETSQQLRDVLRSAREFYQQIADQTRELVFTIKEGDIQRAVTQAKTKILGSLKGFHNTFVDDFAGSIVSLLESSAQTMQDTITANREIEQNQIALRQTLAEAQDQSRAIPLAIGTLPGVSASAEVSAGSGGAGNDTITAEGRRVAEAAFAMAGKDFAPGLAEQCANFVRAVLQQAGVKVGVTQKALDGLDSGSALASSFFGEDIGEIIRDKSKVKAGDLLAFGGTYGGYSKDTITHVGVSTGNGQMVDRSTSSKPVNYRSIDTFEGQNSGFLYAVRPHAYQTPAAPTPTSSGRQQALAAPPNASPESYIGAVLSVLEAPTRQGRVDVAQVIANRAHNNYGGYGSTIKDQAFASGQFQPFFSRNDGGYGISRGEIKDEKSAVSALQKAGYSQKQAQQAIKDFFADIGDTAKVAESQSKIKNFIYFNGTSQAAYKQPQDFQRSSNENFFGNGWYGDNKQYKQSSLSQLFGSGSSQTQSQSNLIKAGVVGPTIASASDIQRQTQLNQYGVQSNAYISKASEEAIANNNKATASIAVNRAAKAQFDRVTRKSDSQKAEGAYRDGLSENRANATQANREAQSLEMSLGPDTPQKQLNQQLVDIANKREDATKDLTRQINLLNEALTKNRALRATIAEMDKSGALDQNPEIAQYAKLLDVGGQAMQSDLDTLNNARDRIDKGYDALTTDVQTKAGAEEAKRLESIQQRLLTLQQERASLMIDLAEPTSPDINREAPLTQNAALQAAQITIDFEQQIAEMRNMTRTGEMTEAEMLDIKAALEEINDLKLEGIKKELREALDENTIALARQELEKTKTALQELGDVTSSRNAIASTKADRFSMYGMDTQADTIKEQLAVSDAGMRLKQELMRIQELEMDGNYSASAIEELRANAEALNAIELSNITAQFDPLTQVIGSARNVFAGFIGDMITGEKTFGEAMGSMLKSFAATLAQMAANRIANEIFAGILGGGQAKREQGIAGAMGGLIPGQQGGGTQSALIGGAVNIFGKLLGFSNGGVVPEGGSEYRTGYGQISAALQKEGPNSVLAALTPGERVLNLREAQQYNRLIATHGPIANFAAGGIVGGKSSNMAIASSSQSINIPINISGGENSNIDTGKLSSAVRAVVLKELQEQRRSGGSLR